MTISERDTSSALLQIGVELGRISARQEAHVRALDTLIVAIQKCIASPSTPPTTTASPPTGRKHSLVDRILGEIAQDALQHLAMKILRWVWRYVVPIGGMAYQFAPGLARWFSEHFGWLI